MVDILSFCISVGGKDLAENTALDKVSRRVAVSMAEESILTLVHSWLVELQSFCV